MPFVVLLALFLFFFVLLPRLTARSAPIGGDARARLIAKGLEARGLVLRASSTGSETTVNGQRFQVRSVVLDVEIPGRPPYEVSLSPMFPRLCEPFPGSALDLRVDPNDAKNVVVVGPAGSSAWLPATAGLFPWASPTPGLATKSGCGTVLVVVVSLFLAAGAALSFLGDHAGSSHQKREPAEPTEEPTRATPEVTPEAPVVVHPSCRAAIRCCATLGHTGCDYAKLSEAACKARLRDLEKAAAKAHKRCE